MWFGKHRIVVPGLCLTNLCADPLRSYTRNINSSCPGLNMSVTNQFTSPAEIDKIYKELHDGFRSGITKSIEFRKEQLLRFAYMFHDNADRFADALAEDLGRPRLESFLTDIGPIINEATWAHDHLDDWLKPEPLEEHPLYSLLDPSVVIEPKGVVAILNAYNYPLFTSRGVPGALAAGCAFVLKPSPLVSATTALLAELFPKYMNQSVYRLVQGGVEEATKLLSLSWGHILFIGSTGVGRIIASAAGKTLTPCTLELGSKNPCIVHSSANMDIAAKRILWGKMLNGGQSCISPDYIIVLEEDKEVFLAALLKAFNECYDVNAKESMTLLKAGKNFDRVKGLLERTKGKIVAGGEIDAKDKYIGPTIVTDVDWDDSLMEEEIFGPVLPIIIVENYEIAFEKLRRYGEPLTACTFHNDDKFGTYARENITSGGWVNNETMMPYGSPLTPVCGRGTSGIGRGYKGKTSFLDFSHFRPCYTVPDAFEASPGIQTRYAPYTEEKLAAMIAGAAIKASRPPGI